MSPRRSREREDGIRALAARQHGLVTRAQLLELGVSSAAVGRRLQAGRLRALHRGVYLLGPLEPERAAFMAAVLAGGPRAVLSHASAGTVWGIVHDPREDDKPGAPHKRGAPDTPGASHKRGAPGTPGAPDIPGSHEVPGVPDRPGGTRVPGASRASGTPIHVTVAGSGRRGRPGIRLHRVATLPESERTVVDGIPITSPGRTIIDLATELGSRELGLATSRAERAGLIDSDALGALLRRHRGRPGIPALRAVLGDGYGPELTRSEAERRCLQLLRTAGLPRPYTNVAVGPYELDMLWPGLGIAIEIDGHAYHASRPSFEGDRRKDAWLRARGIQVVRVTWRQITRDAVATAVQIGQVLALAGDTPRLRDHGVRGGPPGTAVGERYGQRRP